MINQINSMDLNSLKAELRLVKRQGFKVGNIKIDLRKNIDTLRKTLTKLRSKKTELANTSPDMDYQTLKTTLKTYREQDKKLKGINLNQSKKELLKIYNEYTKKGQQTTKVSDNLKSVDVNIESAFFRSYNVAEAKTFKPSQTINDAITFLAVCRPSVEKQMRERLENSGSFKISLVMNAFMKLNEGQVSQIQFHSSAVETVQDKQFMARILNPNDIDRVLPNVMNILLRRIDEFQQNGSGWKFGRGESLTL